MRPAIGYIRVSTAKQGRSGLGIEAQQEALQRFAEAEGYRFAETFTEVESGARTSRVLLLKKGPTPASPAGSNGPSRPRLARLQAQRLNARPGAAAPGTGLAKRDAM